MYIHQRYGISVCENRRFGCLGLSHIGPVVMPCPRASSAKSPPDAVFPELPPKPWTNHFQAATDPELRDFSLLEKAPPLPEYGGEVRESYGSKLVTFAGRAASAPHPMNDRYWMTRSHVLGAPGPERTYALVPRATGTARLESRLRANRILRVARTLLRTTGSPRTSWAANPPR